MSLLVAALLVAGVWGPAIARAQDPCAGVTCSRHGACFSEVSEAYCLCDAGYEAVGHRCRRHHREADLRWLPEVGTRVAEIALSEGGRSAREIGLDRPGAPVRFGDVVSDGTLWCSDFVSWVYRVAGAPFTGGDDGGWLVRTNAAIERWYESRHGWIARGSPEFASYQPNPGDYVRVHTASWGHSAIVHHVDGDTLYTVEGNVSGHVRRIRYRHFRADDRIAGFGRVETLIGARE